MSSNDQILEALQALSQKVDDGFAHADKRCDRQEQMIEGIARKLLAPPELQELGLSSPPPQGGSLGTMPAAAKLK
jgi:hypothetical protein